MTQRLPEAFDLGSFARTLGRRREPHCRRVSGSLQGAIDACSAHADLVMARQLIVTLWHDDQRYREKQHGAFPEDARGACLSNAILLYVRATESGSERPALQIRSKLSPDELELHKQLCDLRKKAIAHFDRGKSVNGRLWAEETIVLTEDMHLRVPIKRVIGQGLLEQGFHPLVEKVLGIAETLRKKRMEQARDDLFDLAERFPELCVDLRKHPFDAVAFFGDKETAADFLTTGEIQTRRTTRHIEYDPPE